MTKHFVSIVAVTALLTVGCAMEHSSEIIAPSPTGPSAVPGAGSNTTPSLVGVFASETLPALPSPTTCGDFRLEITSQTDTSATGTFTGMCGSGLALSGTASGRLDGGAVALEVTGAGAGPGVPTCAFTLAGVGTVLDGGNTLRVPYSGTTCQGPISGTAVLRRPTPPPPPVPPADVSISATPNEPRAGQPVTITVTASSAGQPASGPLRIEFGDGQVANLQIVGSGAASHTFAEGRYNVTAVFTQTDGVEARSTMLLVVQAAEPPPLPNGDQIDVRLITWLEISDISNWGVTARITDWSFDGVGTVCISHTKQGQWPLVSIDENPPNIEAMIGIVVKVNGQWYGAAYDWMGEGRRCKFELPENWGRDQIRTYPLDASWPGPQSGDEVGLWMSTPASNRIPVRSVNERTNIIMVRWP